MKIYTNYYYFILVAGFFFLTSCFHKSPETGTADDVKHAIICHTASSDYLITHEIVFQATSKSSGQKGTHTSGHEDFRYTVRNLQTGAQVTRLVTGEWGKDLLPLGFDRKQVWFYSLDKSVGLHACDPITLKTTITQKQIEQANPALTGKLNIPVNISYASQFYSYDALNKQLIATDLEGNLYSINPVNLKAVHIKKMPSFLDKNINPTSTTAYRGLESKISLTSEIRKQLEINGNKSIETYLNACLLIEQNPNRLSILNAQLQHIHTKVATDMQHWCDSLLQAHPVLKDQQQAYLTIYNDNTRRYYETLSKLEGLKVNSKNDSVSIISRVSNMVLGSDSSVVYLLHANNLTVTSSTLISKIKIKGKNFIPQWTTLVPQIYFTPSLGIKVNPKAEVFKSGSPKFDYQYYGTEGNVFIGIKMLFAFGIDTSTGKLLWKQQL